jgi:hypothetical protein
MQRKSFCKGLEKVISNDAGTGEKVSFKTYFAMLAGRSTATDKYLEQRHRVNKRRDWITVS